MKTSIQMILWVVGMCLILPHASNAEERSLRTFWDQFTAINESNPLLNRNLTSNPPASVVPQNSQPQIPTLSNEFQARENIARCMYLGKLIDENTKLSVESEDAQGIAERSRHLYATLKCSDILQPYEQVFINVDQAMRVCATKEDCQTPTLGVGNTPSGGIQPSADRNQDSQNIQR